jgi:hypothetical protein
VSTVRQVGWWQWPPVFASREGAWPARHYIGRTDPRVRYRRRVIGAALGFLIGVELLFAGLVINVILVAVAGFVVMLACSLLAVTSYRLMTAITTGRVLAQVRQVGKKQRAAKGLRPGKQAGSWLMGRLGGELAASPAVRPLTRFSLSESRVRGQAD